MNQICSQLEELNFDKFSKQLKLYIGDFNYSAASDLVVEIAAALHFEIKGSGNDDVK